MLFVEAIAFGAPIVTAYPSCSIQKVAGDAAMMVMMVEPCNPDEIAEATLLILYDNLLCERLIKMGMGQGGRFSWAPIAMQELDI